MSNFLEFIEEDIQAKKTLFASMPTNTKNNIRRFNERIDTELSKYSEYQKLTKQYLIAKSKSYEINIDNKNEIASLTEKLKKYENIKFILNPSNTYFEKMSFDTLFYQIRNYQDLKFNVLNEIINEFLNKFEMATIFLSEKDFDYTFYVNNFMKNFLEIRRLNSKNYEKMSEIFEKIYWVNPEIIQHIELNFRKLIRKHEKKFEEYIERKQKSIIEENKINYGDCLDKLKDIYVELQSLEKENITDIIELSNNNEIDINNYFKDSKSRISTFNELMIEPIKFSDKKMMEKFYENLSKLKHNLKEYENFIKFVPLFEDFKKEYFSKDNFDTNNLSKTVKELESKIIGSEKKLSKLNKKIMQNNKLFPNKEKNVKELKFESFKMANELCAIYKDYEKESFRLKVFSLISANFTVSDLLHLYYSFDYFKKMAIKNIYKINVYDEIMEYSDSFDLFAMNPTNLIIKGITLNSENNIAKTIVNKYRIVNINITEDDINSGDVSVILAKINMLLRIKEIDNSATSVEKIWFITQVHKIKE